MPDIRVENLSKCYRIGLKERMSETLGGALASFFKSPFDNMKRLRGLTIDSGDYGSKRSLPDDIITALDEVSFEVKEGEVLGIIGRNGAGKSTLLKIISRIVEPTGGRVLIKGRVASLLEVGTGFHPELTGRENVFLNGAILGMSRAEIRRKYDAIVDFAEIERFMDTPIKRYSSGMKVRLAFAVAAHLEPEILLIDEVLAVGDAAFQRKCLGKVEDVARAGRTILFVSHNMGAVETLCSRALLLRKGRLERSGPTQEVVSEYLAENFRHADNPFEGCPRSGNGKLRVTGFRLEDPDGGKVEFVQSGNPVVFAFDFENYKCGPKDAVCISFSIRTDREQPLFHNYSSFSNAYFRQLPSKGSFKCLIPDLPLSPGNYLIQCRCVINGDHKTGEEADWPKISVPINVLTGDFFRTGNTNLSTWGPILVRGYWSTSESG